MQLRCLYKKLEEIRGFQGGKNKKPKESKVKTIRKKKAFEKLPCAADWVHGRREYAFILLMCSK